MNILTVYLDDTIKPPDKINEHKYQIHPKNSQDENKYLESN